MHRRPTHALFVTAAALAVILSASSNAATDSPYIISKKVFRKQVSEISLSPLTVPDILPLSDSLRDMIEQEAIGRLQKTKLEVVGIAPYAQLRAIMTEQIGGLADETGAVDPRRRAVVWDHAKREMRLRYPVDAFAEISIRVVRAPFSDDRAEWDGVRQKVKSSGDGFAPFGGKNYQGSVAAASFQLAIFDRSDALLFVKRAGIEVLQEREGSQLVLRPTAELLQDEKKIRKAVKVAFAPL